MTITETEYLASLTRIVESYARSVELTEIEWMNQRYAWSKSVRNREDYIIELANKHLLAAPAAA